MDSSNNNNFTTPEKVKFVCLTNTPNSNASETVHLSPPSYTTRNSSLASTGSQKKFTLNEFRVTSTPFSKPSTVYKRMSAQLRGSKYSIMPDNEEDRVDISIQVNSFRDNCTNNEKFLNEIHLNNFSFKFSRLNAINKDLLSNEFRIFLHPDLYNCFILLSKFVFQRPLCNISTLQHRYDGDIYVLKQGDGPIKNHLSESSLKIIHEIKILKLLGHHPHIQKYSDSWIEEGKMFLQVESVPGGSLHDHLTDDVQRLSNQASLILLAHMSSVLVYIHEILHISHGSITTKNILLDFVSLKGNTSSRECVYQKCHEAINDDNINKNLRFKLCDFSQSSHKDGFFNTFKDIYSLGLVFLQCLIGLLSDEMLDQCNIADLAFQNMVPPNSLFIIQKLCNKDIRQQWTAKDVMSLEDVKRFILPETFSYYEATQNVKYIDDITPGQLDVMAEMLSNSLPGYWVPSDKEVVNISPIMESIAQNRKKNEEGLLDIHTTYAKILCHRLNRFKCSDNCNEKRIFEHPVLYNSDVTTYKFTSQSLISDRKLSQIYIVDHRFDSHRYILKVGLQPSTTYLSDTSREIINDMRILKLIGHHPNVINYCDSWIEQERFHLQLEYISGGSLYDFIHGHADQFYAINDTEKRVQKLKLSLQSTSVLLAHMASVLTYMHGELDIFHGDIKPSNILVDLVGSPNDIDYFVYAKSNCSDVLVSEEVNRNLRFKLCDFGRSGLTGDVGSMEEGDGRYLPNLNEAMKDSKYATTRDIFSLGITIFECYCGMVDCDYTRELRAGKRPDFPDSVPNNWRNIIQNMTHLDPDQRWTAQCLVALPEVQPHVLPEAEYHVTSSARYVAQTAVRAPYFPPPRTPPRRSSAQVTPFSLDDDDQKDFVEVSDVTEEMDVDSQEDFDEQLLNSSF